MLFAKGAVNVNEKQENLAHLLLNADYEVVKVKGKVIENEI